VATIRFSVIGVVLVDRLKTVRNWLRLPFAVNQPPSGAFTIR
jgi:hypothetical protein